MNGYCKVHDIDKPPISLLDWMFQQKPKPQVAVLGLEGSGKVTFFHNDYSHQDNSFAPIRPCRTHNYFSSRLVLSEYAIEHQLLTLLVCKLKGTWIHGVTYQEFQLPLQLCEYNIKFQKRS